MSRQRDGFASFCIIKVFLISCLLLINNLLCNTNTHALSWNWTNDLQPHVRRLFIQRWSFPEWRHFTVLLCGAGKDLGAMSGFEVVSAYSRGSPHFQQLCVHSDFITYISLAEKIECHGQFPFWLIRRGTTWANTLFKSVQNDVSVSSLFLLRERWLILPHDDQRHKPFRFLFGLRPRTFRVRQKGVFGLAALYLIRIINKILCCLFLLRLKLNNNNSIKIMWNKCGWYEILYEIQKPTVSYLSEIYFYWLYSIINFTLQCNNFFLNNLFTF